MNEKGNRYALSALRNRRATMAAEIVHLERQLRHLKESMVHVDMTLRLLDPAYDPATVPKKRIVIKRIKLFRQGELGRMILGALRNADGKPLSTSQIVSAILAAGGHGNRARPTVAPRVRGNLAYLERRAKVRKTGQGKSARWGLV